MKDTWPTFGVFACWFVIRGRCFLLPVGCFFLPKCWLGWHFDLISTVSFFYSVWVRVASSPSYWKWLWEGGIYIWGIYIWRRNIYIYIFAIWVIYLYSGILLSPDVTFRGGPIPASLADLGSLHSSLALCVVFDNPTTWEKLFEKSWGSVFYCILSYAQFKLHSNKLKKIHRKFCINKWNFLPCYFFCCHSKVLVSRITENDKW